MAAAAMEESERALRRRGAREITGLRRRESAMSEGLLLRLPLPPTATKAAAAAAAVVGFDVEF